MSSAVVCDLSGKTHPVAAMITWAGVLLSEADFKGRLLRNRYIWRGGGSISKGVCYGIVTSGGGEGLFQRASATESLHLEGGRVDFKSQLQRTRYLWRG